MDILHPLSLYLIYSRFCYSPLSSRSLRLSVSIFQYLFSSMICHFIVSTKLCRTSTFFSWQPNNQIRIKCKWMCVCVSVLICCDINALWFDEKLQEMESKCVNENCERGRNKKGFVEKFPLVPLPKLFYHCCIVYTYKMEWFAPIHRKCQWM